jgi:hypothetical protein
VNVFISYRRSDTQDLAGRIADRLRAVPQIGQVFIDVEQIEAGVDFVARLGTALAKSDVCLLLIGPNWRGQREEGRPRIFDERDFVRLEAATALAGERKLLPVLANGALMPAVDELPDDLQPLSRINALAIRHAYFDHDLELLIDALLSRKKPGRAIRYLKRHQVQAGALRALAGIAVSVVLLVVGAALHGMFTQRSLEESLGGAGPVWLLIAAILAIGGSAGVGMLGGRRNQGVRR